MGALEVVETTLAAWRLASLLVNEDGPWSIFSRLRYKAGIRKIVTKDVYGTTSISTVTPNTIAEGLTCVWCTSMWAALALVACSALPVPVRPFVRAGRQALAISAGAIIVHEAIERCRR